MIDKQPEFYLKTVEILTNTLQVGTECNPSSEVLTQNFKSSFSTFRWESNNDFPQYILCLLVQTIKLTNQL